MRRGGAFVWLLTLAYLGLLGWILLGADRRLLRRAGTRIYSWVGDAVPESVQPFHYEIALLVLLFVPLGWLLLRATQRSVAWVAVGGVWLAIMVEAAQSAVLDRSGSFVDVIAASVGAILGAVLGRPRGD